MVVWLAVGCASGSVCRHSKGNVIVFSAKAEFDKVHCVCGCVCVGFVISMGWVSVAWVVGWALVPFTANGAGGLGGVDIFVVTCAIAVVVAAVLRKINKAVENPAVGLAGALACVAEPVDGAASGRGRGRVGREAAFVAEPADGAASGKGQGHGSCGPGCCRVWGGGSHGVLLRWCLLC